MELKVQNSQFSNNGGGGGTFYMGRGQGDGQRRKRDDDEDAAPELAADAFEAGDRLDVPLPARQPSRLSIWSQRPPTPAEVDEAAVLAELEQAVRSKLGLLAHALGRLERDYARRLRAEIGEMRIGA